MRVEERKAALAAYKERKIDAGIYAVRCRASGEVWVGQTPNLDKIWNRLWFTLNQGGNSCRSLQAAWSRHGAADFAFEILERIEEEEASSYVRNALLKERMVRWRSDLGAQAL